MSIIGKFLKIAGKDPNGNAKGVAVTENGEVKVQQTGSNVTIIVNHHGINVLDGRTYSYIGSDGFDSRLSNLTTIDISNVAKRTIYVKNNYSIQVEVSIAYTEDVGVDNQIYLSEKVILAAGAKKIFSDADFPRINERLTSMSVIIEAASIDAGSIDIIVYGGAS